MSAPKADVLAWIEHAKQFGGSPGYQTMQQVYDAVAELIEADRAYDAAQFSHVGRAEKIEASRRRKAALARIGGDV